MPVIPSRFPASAQDQVNYLMRRGGNQQLHCVMTLDGQLDAERIAQAVRLSVEAEPVLGCRFVEHPRRPYWERCDDLAHLPLCRVIEAQDPEAAIWRFITTPIDSGIGARVQVRVFRSAGDILCVKVDHVAADIGGTKRYVYLLAEIYRRLAADPGYCPEPNLHGSRGQGQVLRQFQFWTLLKALLGSFNPPPAWHFPSQGSDHSSQTFAVRRIGPERFRSIKEYGRQFQTSLNEVLLTAFYRALFEIINPPTGVPLPVLVPVDLRRYLPEARAGAVYNLSGIVLPAISREEDAGFDDTLIQVQKAMQPLKTNNPGLGAAMLLELAFLPGFAPMQRMVSSPEDRLSQTHPNLSNFGVIAQQQIDFDPVPVTDAYLLSPVLYPPGFMLGVSTYRQTVTFSVGFCDSATDRREVERFLNLFKTELPA
jgi:NRPS condensation-like uncharacterized protein